MRFTPKSEEEIQTESLIPEGNYPFEVVNAKDKLSKSGNEMIELTLKVWDANGSERTVFDYLLEAMSFKLKHFCEAVGLSHKYTDGTLSADDCIGKMGKAIIAIVPPKDGYPSKNNVRDYWKPDTDAAEKTKAAPAEPAFKDSDIPF